MMVAQDWDDGDAALASDILGTADRDAAIAIIRAWLAGQGHGNVDILSLALSVGVAVTIGLPNGEKRLAKFWSPAVERSALAAQLQVQNAMAKRGFAAPEVLSRLESCGDGCGVLMAFDQSGAPTDVRIPGVADAMAQGLARLVREGHDLMSTPQLPRRRLPAALWPRPHSVLFDFEATADGAEWIDTLARRALETLRAASGQQVLGHLDWSAKNMRMEGLALAVVYDWDAIFVADEADVVGSAAASFPTTWDLPVPAIPTREQSLAFIAAYAGARETAFTAEEHHRVLAAATYAQCYTARCDHALDPDGARRRWASVLGKLSM